uniref:Transmembrane protein 33 n=1 Tax=Rhabditophanes sp. KR3021 TaxID=114890 RepID=A0AC35U1T2_9BILA
MVDIREENSETPEQTGSGNAANSSQSDIPPPTHPSLLAYLKGDHTNALLFVLRLSTIFFSISYAIPYSQKDSHYGKAIAAAAVTNAIRLGQRLGGFQLTREFLATVMIEDSFHYFMYCVLFYMNAPVSMALAPVALYALLHSVNYANKVDNAIGLNNGLVKAAHTLMAQQTNNLLGIVACSEIFMFPVLFAMIMTGQGTVLMPFMYYRFLSLRYSSRRNPYTKVAFTSMKVSLTNAISSESCPQIVRTIVYKLINLVERLAPTQNT